MALQVPSFATKFGTLTNTYWRWESLAINVRDTKATVTLRGYVNKAAYDNGNEDIGYVPVTIEGEAFGSLAIQLDGPTPVAISQVIYGYVVANEPLFAGAVSV